MSRICLSILRKKQIVSVLSWWFMYVNIAKELRYMLPPAYSPCRLKYFWHIRRRLRRNKTILKLPLSPCTLKTIQHNYRIHLNTSGVFFDYNKTLLVYFKK
jgi:hypothetical protein